MLKSKNHPLIQIFLYTKDGNAKALIMMTQQIHTYASQQKQTIILYNHSQL